MRGFRVGIVVGGAAALGVGVVAACSSFGSGTSAPEITDAPSNGETSPDAPPLQPDAGSDSACPAFATLCDDFEVGDLRRWSSTAGATPPATMSVDDGGPPHRGNFALHFAAPKGDGGAIASYVSSNFDEVKDGAVAFRLYLRVSAPLAEGASFLSVTKSKADGAASVLFSSNGNWAVRSAGGSLDGGKSVTSNTPVALDRWLCVEWIVDIGSAARQQLFVDDVAEPVLARTMDTLGDVNGGYVRAVIALNANSSAARALFIDDFAMAFFPTQTTGPRIGCIR